MKIDTEETRRFLGNFFKRFPEGGHLEIRIKNFKAEKNAPLKAKGFFLNVEEVIPWLEKNYEEDHHVWFGPNPRFKLSEETRLDFFTEKFLAIQKKRKKDEKQVSDELLDRHSGQFKKALLAKYPELGGSGEYVRYAICKFGDFDCTIKDDLVGVTDENHKKMLEWGIRQRTFFEDEQIEAMGTDSGNGVQTFAFFKEPRLLLSEIARIDFGVDSKNFGNWLADLDHTSLVSYDKGTSDVSRVVRLVGFPNPKGGRTARVIWETHPKKPKNPRKAPKKPLTLQKALITKIGANGRYAHILSMLGSLANARYSRERAKREVEDWIKNYCEVPPPELYINNTMAGYDEWLAKAMNKGIGENPEEQVCIQEVAQDILREKTFITPRDTQEILVCDGGVYRPGGEVIINELAKRNTNEKITKHQTNEVTHQIKTESYVDREQINGHPNLIPLRDGIWDIKHKTLMEYDDNYYFTFYLPINYDANGKCPNFLKFLREVIHQDDIPVVQEVFGYCLLRSYPIQKAIMLIGGGANGKSVLLEVIKRYLGPENTCAVSLQELESNRFAKHQLYGKLANLYADLSDKALEATGVFKQLTGGDMLSAEEKFKSHINFTNHAKLINSTNKIPKTHDLTSAFFRRWIFINFPHVFTDDGANGTKRRDGKILEKITTPEELSGVLNWALEGLDRLLKNGKFSNSVSTADIEKDWIRRSDSLGAFIMDSIKYNSSKAVSKQEFYSVYGKYCRDKKLTPIAYESIGKQIGRHLQVEGKRIGPKNNRVHAWVGIDFIDNLMGKNLDYSDTENPCQGSGTPNPDTNMEDFL